MFQELWFRPADRKVSSAPDDEQKGTTIILVKVQVQPIPEHKGSFLVLYLRSDFQNWFICYLGINLSDQFNEVLC